MLKNLILLSGLFIFSSCIVQESDYNKLDEDEIESIGLKELTQNKKLVRDSTGTIISTVSLLEKEGYKFIKKYGDSWTYQIKFQNRSFEFDYPVFHTYLFDDHLITFSGMIGIESGFFRYFTTPKHSRLTVFNRDDFQLLDQKTIMGVIRNVQLIDKMVYFRVDKNEEIKYGSYSITGEE